MVELYNTLNNVFQSHATSSGPLLVIGVLHQLQQLIFDKFYWL